MSAVAPIPTREDYLRAFVQEQQREYPNIDDFEQRCGYAIDRDELEAAARVLACPVKRNPPSWQHGRVIYAAVRQHLDGCKARIVALDIGTAKGFSALMLRRALDDAGVNGDVVSVDVINPTERTYRNSIRDLDGPTTITELLADYPEAVGIRFFQSTGIDWLKGYTGRIAVAFVDGKHSYDAVKAEGKLLADRQHPGDLVVFDDVQIAPVRKAIEDLRTCYQIDYLSSKPDRVYAIARRV